ncbi:hypothetical protein D9758_009131 [Tetrapyrgos nigripes]|uniref:Phospholipid/glycerol acyltransferase domain-containing protein n=1 Tax=Tetrapyrgos nigripes TaxID=182062 RepID=A0A8H5G8G6_9AGAR|nr:hypothetical protein D9758_009131 [Tetrapyrgos nigripes]
MVELKLVYRFLRRVSDWTTDGYYADVQVIGSENIPKDHPIIIASTHHNEMIDIATLAATIPHRRYLSFWAKSSMFAHPVTNFVMSSVGAIPVKRNPNKAEGGAAASPSPSHSQSQVLSGSVDLSSSHTTQSQSQSPQNSQSSLFLSTSETLASNGIVGVFVEGTSYTQPKILQVLSGAAWAAVEFLKWQHERERLDMDGGKKEKELKELLLIPVGLVYTDKSRYMSRIRIEYGQPIPLEDYKALLFPSPSPSTSSNPSSTEVETDPSSLPSSAEWPSSLSSSYASVSLSASQSPISASAPQPPPSTTSNQNISSPFSSTRLSETEIVKSLTSKIHTSLLSLTINAPDWETLYSVQIARQILWGDDDNVPLGPKGAGWVEVGQVLVELLTTLEDADADTHTRDDDEKEHAAGNENANEEEALQSQNLERLKNLRSVKKSLTTYFSLLHYADISHATLEAMFPLRVTLPTASSASTQPTTDMSVSAQRFPHHLPKGYILRTLLRSCSPFSIAQNIITTIPLLALLPTLPIYIPAYLSSYLITRLLSTPGEEEGLAQFRGIGGGIGRMVASGIIRSRVYDRLQRQGVLSSLYGRIFGQVGSALPLSLTSLLTPMSTTTTRSPVVLPPALVKFITVIIFDNLLVAYYKFLTKRTGVVGRVKVLWGVTRLIFGSVWESVKSLCGLGRSGVDMGRYMTPPPPPENAFIRRQMEKQQQQNKDKDKDGEGSKLDSEPETEPELRRLPPPVSLAKLLVPLLYAREEARGALGGYLRGVARSEVGEKERAQTMARKAEWLRVLGAEIP